MKNNIIAKTKSILFVIVLCMMIFFFIKNRQDFLFLKETRFTSLLIVAGLQLITFVFMSVRFFITVRFVTSNISFLESFRCFIISGFLGSLLPQGAGIYRAISLKKNNALQVKKYLAIHVFFIWINLYLTFLAGILLLARYNPRLSLSGIPFSYIFLFLFCLCVALLPFLKTARLFLKKTRRQKESRILSQIQFTLETIESIIREKTVLLSSILIISINIVISTIILHFGFGSVGIKTDPSTLAIFLVLARLGNLINIIPGNLGIREFLFGFLGNAFGIGISVGVGVSMILRMITYLVHGSLALISITTERFDRGPQRPRQMPLSPDQAKDE